MLKATGHTDIGIKRRVNQDSYALRVVSNGGQEVAFAIVCDGLGGLAQGEVVSGAVVCAYLDWFKRHTSELMMGLISLEYVKTQWKTLMDTVNLEVFRAMCQGNVRGGTTVTALLVAGRQFLAINVGDSRLYQFDGQTLTQVTKDHSLIQRELDAGLITMEQALVDKRKNVLMRCLGVEQEVRPDFYCGTVDGPQAYLLCSDGFRNALTPDELSSVFFKPGQCGTQSTIPQLIELAKSRGETDNMTAVCVYADLKPAEEEATVDLEKTPVLLWSDDYVEDKARDFWLQCQLCAAETVGIGNQTR